MTTDGQPQTEKPSVANSLSGLTHDVIELAELQAQLFALDVKETSQGTRTALILAVVGACALLGAVPIALTALAELLIAQLSWSSAASYGVATLVGIMLASALLVAAWVRFRSGVVTLKRSRDELSRNLAWVKANLRSRTTRNPTANN